MSYVYMKVLESAPGRYDRGMRILTLGRLERVHILARDGQQFGKAAVGQQAHVLGKHGEEAAHEKVGHLVR